ncbi:pentatricopeptide repeat-containing protein At2g13600-like [Aristolochia californica]|uniref:pentatricopeptide repeat-containing protein At2g13600-like n=1 Tax=Aristolochia californica TaxID=171875 RepID=UPI0035DAB07E
MTKKASSALLNLFSEGGKWREVFSLYHRMRSDGFQPDTFSFPVLLKSCSADPSLIPLGRSVHANALKRGFGVDPYVNNALITMYAKCGYLHKALQVLDEISEPGPALWNTAISCFFHAGDCNSARQVFERVREPNVVTWSAMISGYTQNGRADEALLVFKRMRGEWAGISDETGICLLPNANTVAGVLAACVQLRDIGSGMQVHAYAEKISTFTESDTFVGSILIDLFGRCGKIELAQRAFDFMVEKCVVVWSTLISAYVNNECHFGAIEVFRGMTRGEIKPNYFTHSMLINACGSILNLQLGKELHGFIVRNQIGPDIVVSTALIDMYSKCGLIEYAKRVFQVDSMFFQYNRTPMWNALMVGQVGNNRLVEAWDLFRSMTHYTKPNEVTMAIVLPTCARSSLLQCGKEVHCYCIKYGLDVEILVGNALVDMYSKCGKIELAKFHFDRMPRKNRISWTTMIDGFGMNGDGEGAISIFLSMVSDNHVEPDQITFVALISACSHAGLVDKGLEYFKIMTEDFGLIPSDENYGCVVDLLARGGRIDEAKNLIASMPKKPGPNVWGALLSACRIHGAINEAELALKHLLELDANEAGFQALMSNIYADVGRMEGVQKVRKAMKDMGVGKRPGCSWLEISSGTHEIDGGRHRSVEGVG